MVIWLWMHWHECPMNNEHWTTTIWCMYKNEWEKTHSKWNVQLENGIQLTKFVTFVQYNWFVSRFMHIVKLSLTNKAVILFFILFVLRHWFVKVAILLHIIHLLYTDIAPDSWYTWQAHLSAFKCAFNQNYLFTSDVHSNVLATFTEIGKRKNSDKMYANRLKHTNRWISSKRFLCHFISQFDHSIFVQFQFQFQSKPVNNNKQFKWIQSLFNHQQIWILVSKLCHRTISVIRWNCIFLWVSQMNQIFIAGTSIGVPIASGLEYLVSVDQLLVQQKIELLEAITGFETKNKFLIKNTLGQNVMQFKNDRIENENRFSNEMFHI